MNKLGQVVKKLRIYRKMSVKALSIKSGLSERQIYRIESGQEQTSKIITINLLSEALRFNLSDYLKIMSYFDSFDQYIEYTNLLSHINKKNLKQIRAFLNRYSTNKLPYAHENLLYQAILYAKTMLVSENKSGNEKGLTYCYKALNMTETRFSPLNISSFITTEFSLLIFCQLENFLYRSAKYEESLLVTKKIIEYIEENYLNENFVALTLPHMVLRVYITELNNYADYLFKNNQYEESLKLAILAYNILKSYRSCFAIDLIFILLIENNYLLNDIEKANEYLKKSIMHCISHDLVSNAIYIKNKIINHYPKLINKEVFDLIG